MKTWRKSAALAISVALLGFGVSGLMAAVTTSPAGAITAGAIHDAPGTGTAAPPTTIGGLAMTPFPTDPGDTSCSLPNPITPCLETSAPGPSGENVTFSQSLWHQSGVDGFPGDSYQADTQNGAQTVTLTMPANTRAFYFYFDNQFGSHLTITAHDPAGDISVGPTGIVTSPTEIGFYTQDGSSITSLTLADSGITPPNFTDDLYGRFGINVATPVTISAPNPIVTYGNAVPVPEPIYSTGVATSTPATCAYTPTSPKDAGVYPVTCSGAADSDAIISYAGGGTSATGQLTIDKAALSVHPDNKSMVFGGTAPSYTETFSGLVGGDTQTSESALTTCSAGPPTPPIFPGNYSIDCFDTDTNYSQTDFVGTLTITTAPLTVTANNASMTYGGTYPTLSATFTGLVLGQSQGAENALTTCTSAPANSPVGTYPISCTDSDPNYGPITYVPGTLTVSSASLTVTAKSASMVYLGTYPTLGATFNGLVNGDTAAKEKTFTTCTSAPANSVPGSYPITCSDTDPDYGPITYVDGTLTILKAPTAFTISEFVTKGKHDNTAVLSETGLPLNAVGTVLFETGSGMACVISLTGKPGEATSCFANLGPNLPYVISAIFIDTDGDYLNSTASNTLNPHD